MRGLMMDRPLLISSLLEHAERVHPDREIVSRAVEGGVHRSSWGRIAERSRRLAGALATLGVRPGERIGTIAWNGYRHLEIYYAVSGMGAVCHTLNPRLHSSQMSYIVNHAEDRFLFVDLTFVPLLEALIGELESVEGVIVMCDRDHLPDTNLPRTLCYEDLIEGCTERFDWPELDEHTASSLCYTSGTTGHPKGVLYSNRSTVLHSFAIALPNAVGLGESSCVLPVVPMFHVNAWGVPYAGAMTGAKLVMPGPALDGASLTELLLDEEVTLMSGVPTVWLGLLAHWREHGTRVPALRQVVIGGAAAPLSMIRAFEEDYDVRVIHAWGMTETSPVGTVNQSRPAMQSWPSEERWAHLRKQGRPLYGVETRIVDEDGCALPHDGEAFGELEVKGPWVCSGYFRSETSEAHTQDGWFRTGDVSTLDPDGTMQITDRKKDLIKSGGEWISSIELENIAMGHPDVAQAAVIGVPDEKWGERPLLVVVPSAGSELSGQDVLAAFAGKVADWWIPDEVVVRDSLPIGATGKVQKLRLREIYGS